MGSSSSDSLKILLLRGRTTDNHMLGHHREKLENSVGCNGCFTLDSFEEFLSLKHASSFFDTVYTGTVSSLLKSSETLAEILRVLKPGGCFIVRDPVDMHGGALDLKEFDKLVTLLKLSGFTDISRPQVIPKSQQLSEDLFHFGEYKEEPFCVIECKACKPNFEIGSSIKLPLSKKAAEYKPDEEVAKLWALTMEDSLDESIELVNEDDLLDEDDLKRPNPTSLKVCATTKKRKACKDCTCGLAEELENEKKVVQSKTANSSCGSCYLGDAFRCASCPYLGFPAFRPGEKITLVEGQLKSDS